MKSYRLQCLLLHWKFGFGTFNEHLTKTTTDENVINHAHTHRSIHLPKTVRFIYFFISCHYQIVTYDVVVEIWPLVGCRLFFSSFFSWRYYTRTMWQIKMHIKSHQQQLYEKDEKKRKERKTACVCVCVYSPPDIDFYPVQVSHTVLITCTLMLKHR